MHIRFFKTFIHLARVKNFRETASLLGTSQPVISSRIKKLEEDLGIRLFERTGRGVNLTPEGRLLLPHAELIVDRANEMKEMLAFSANAEGALKVGVTDAVLHTWLTDLIDRFRQRFPKISLQLYSATSAEILQAMRERDVDIGLVIYDSKDPMMQVLPLGSLKMVWVANPKAFPMRSASLETMLSLPIITFPNYSNPFRTIERFMRTADVVRPNISPSNSIATIVKLVTHGYGVAPMPRAVVRRELETGELHEVAVSPEFPPMELHAVTEISPRHSLRNEMAAMAQAAAERFAREWPGDYVFGD